MTREQFERLPTRTKCYHTPQVAYHMMTIEEYYYGIALYSLHGFYIELWYHLQWQTIIKIRSFEQLSPDSPYLQRIRFQDDLLKVG